MDKLTKKGIQVLLLIFDLGYITATLMSDAKMAAIAEEAE